MQHAQNGRCPKHSAPITLYFTYWSYWKLQSSGYLLSWVVLWVELGFITQEMAITLKELQVVQSWLLNIECAYFLQTTDQRHRSNSLTRVDGQPRGAAVAWPDKRNRWVTWTCFCSDLLSQQVSRCVPGTRRDWPGCSGSWQPVFAQQCQHRLALSYARPLLWAPGYLPGGCVICGVQQQRRCEGLQVSERFLRAVVPPTLSMSLLSWVLW